MWCLEFKPWSLYILCNFSINIELNSQHWTNLTRIVKQICIEEKNSTISFCENCKNIFISPLQLLQLENHLWDKDQLFIQVGQNFYLKKNKLSYHEFVKCLCHQSTTILKTMSEMFLENVWPPLMECSFNSTMYAILSIYDCCIHSFERQISSLLCELSHRHQQNTFHTYLV